MLFRLICQYTALVMLTDGFLRGYLPVAASNLSEIRRSALPHTYGGFYGGVDNIQHGEVHPLPQICGGQRCYQHHIEAERCCEGYRCSFRLPFLGGMCIRDIGIGDHHHDDHVTPVPPGVPHTHSSVHLSEKEPQVV